jgi:hypothetical protein
MRPYLYKALALLSLGLAGGALLGGCGSSTKTVSSTAALPATANPDTTTRSGATTTSTTGTRSSPTGGTSTSSTTHTAPEPAFTEQETDGEGVGAAASAVRSRGYTPNSTAEYHANQTLRVLVGTRTGSGDGYGQQAFFFVAGRYIGTDTKEPSAKVKVLSQSDTEVALAYPLYRKGDPLSSPSGGHATVRFQLNNGKLMALGHIPPVSSTTGFSRY